jgi:hypothetical protein
MFLVTHFGYRLNQGLTTRISFIHLALWVVAQQLEQSRGEFQMMRRAPCFMFANTILLRMGESTS